MRGLPGGVIGVRTEMQMIRASKPHTQLHYQAGDHKLQRITALHAQERNRPFNRPGRMQLLFVYGGASDAGDYPESRLRRQRQLLLRTRYQRYTWSLELLYLHNQRRLGAHSGVLGTDDFRYNRLIAQVIGKGRTRRTVRNDILSTLNTRVLTASIYLSSESLRYEGIGSSARRYGTSLFRDFRSKRHRIRTKIEAYLQRIPQSPAHPTGHRTSRFEIQIRDSLRWQAAAMIVQAGIQNQNGVWSPSGHFQWKGALSAFHPFMELTYRVAPDPSAGWGAYLVNESLARGRILQMNARVEFHLGRLTVEPYGYISNAWDVSDYWETSIDSIRVISDTYSSKGAGLRLTLEAEPDRGLYAELNAGLAQTGRTRYRADSVFPKWALSGQLGFRTVLFTGDLRLNAFVRGRSWSAMTSRTLHAPTGLLVLPSEKRPAVDASYILDVGVEGRIRVATVYIIYENAVSGTGLMIGNELVADYPLPAGQLRFGVYWPIIN